MLNGKSVFLCSRYANCSQLLLDIVLAQNNHCRSTVLVSFCGLSRKRKLDRYNCRWCKNCPQCRSRGPLGILHFHTDVNCTRALATGIVLRIHCWKCPTAEYRKLLCRNIFAYHNFLASLALIRIILLTQRGVLNVFYFFFL